MAVDVAHQQQRDCGRFYIPEKVIEGELQKRKHFGLSPDVRQVPAGEDMQHTECIQSGAGGQDQQRLAGSWRVNCRQCGGDISEPMDKRSAKKYANEHRKNQHHEPVLIKEGLPLARA
jgi:hypothetical protein